MIGRLLSRVAREVDHGRPPPSEHDDGRVSTAHSFTSLMFDASGSERMQESPPFLRGNRGIGDDEADQKIRGAGGRGGASSSSTSGPSKAATNTLGGLGVGHGLVLRNGRSSVGCGVLGEQEDASILPPHVAGGGHDDTSVNDPGVGHQHNRDRGSDAESLHRELDMLRKSNDNISWSFPSGSPRALPSNFLSPRAATGGHHSAALESWQLTHAAEDTSNLLAAAGVVGVDAPGAVGGGPGDRVEVVDYNESSPGSQVLLRTGEGPRREEVTLRP
eukprot:GSA25T00010855001.1